MASHLEGKVVVVTGAAAGFGRLISEGAAARGAAVVGGDVDAVTLTETFQGVTDAGGRASSLATDVTDLAAVRALVAHAVETFGRVDVMVNNAGTMPLAFFADHADAAAAWDRCIDINLKGVLHGIIATQDQMLAQGRGHVVNISSIYGNFPNAGAGVYTATKAAVNVLGDTLRVESQGRIKVSTIRPTGIPGTGLSASVVNQGAIVGILGQHLERSIPRFIAHATGTLEPEELDEDSPRLWTLEPQHLADQVLYVMDQPWGICISDLTVRATGEDYVL